MDLTGMSCRNFQPASGAVINPGDDPFNTFGVRNISMSAQRLIGITL